MQASNHSPYYARAALFGGIAIAWGCINPSSSLGYISSVVSGAVGSVFAVLAVERAYERFDEWVHNVAKPVTLSIGTSEYDEAFNKAFERIKLHPYYQFYKNIILNTEQTENNELKIHIPTIFNYSNHISYKDDGKDVDVSKQLKEGLSTDYCLGSTLEFLRILEKNPRISGAELLNSISMENVFYFQLLHSIQKTIETVEQGTKTDAWDIKRRFHPSCNISHEYPDPEPDEISEDRFRKLLLSKLRLSTELGKKLTKILQEINQDLIPWKEAQGPFFSAKKSAEVFQMNFESVAKSPSNSENPQIFSGRITLEASNPNKKNSQNVKHSIAFQCFKGKFRCYDVMRRGYSEYQDQTEFFEALKKHIHVDFSSLGYTEVFVQYVIRKP